MEPVSAVSAASAVHTVAPVQGRGADGHVPVPAAPALAPAPLPGALAATAAAGAAATLDAALEALERGQPRVALQLLDLAWHAFGRDELAWVVRSDALFRLGRDVDASGVAARGLADVPRSLALRALLAAAAERLGEPGIAGQALRDALALAPGDPVLLRRLAALEQGAAPVAGPVHGHADAAAALPLADLHALLAPDVRARALRGGPAGEGAVVPGAAAGLVPWLLGVRPAVSPAATIRLALVGAGAVLFASGERMAGALLVGVAFGTMALGGGRGGAAR